MKVLITSISFSKNNIFFSLSTLQKQVLITKSLHKSKGIKKLNFVAFNSMINFIVKLIRNYGSQSTHLRLKGVNKFKNTVLKVFKKTPLKILTILDSTSGPYNGCRKRRKKHF